MSVARRWSDMDCGARLRRSFTSRSSMVFIAFHADSVVDTGTHNFVFLAPRYATVLTLPPSVHSC